MSVLQYAVCCHGLTSDRARSATLTCLDNADCARTAPARPRRERRRVLRSSARARAACARCAQQALVVESAAWIAQGLASGRDATTSREHHCARDARERVPGLGRLAL